MPSSSASMRRYSKKTVRPSTTLRLTPSIDPPSGTSQCSIVRGPVASSLTQVPDSHASEPSTGSVELATLGGELWARGLDARAQEMPAAMPTTDAAITSMVVVRTSASWHGPDRRPILPAMRLFPCTLTLALVLAACGDDATGTDSTGSTSAASTEGSSSGGTPGTTTSADGSTGSSGGETTAASSGETTAGSTAGETEGETTAATSEGSSSEGGSTDGGMASIDAAMSGLMIFQDCMPIVPPDPVGASFTLELTNTGDVPASATVVSATFINAGGMAVGTIDVSPNAFGPIAVGGNSMTVVTKVPNSLTPPNGCGVVQCFQGYSLELELDVDGSPVLVSDTANVDCVF